MKYFIAITLSVVFFAKFATAKTYSLEEILQLSKQNSPILAYSTAKIERVSAEVKLISAAYFPILNIDETFSRSTNPVNVFAMKLNQQQFTMNDFAIDKLNEPDSRDNYQTSINVYLPLDISGEIGLTKKSAERMKEASTHEMKWRQKEVQKNIYTLFYAYKHLGEMKIFLEKELDYLKKFIAQYDSKNKDNKNRYLSYNQARILKENVEEGIEILVIEKKNINNQMIFISGIADLIVDETAPVSLTKELEKWKNAPDKPLNRDDLQAMQSQLQAADFWIKKEKRSLLPRLGIFTDYQIHSFDLNDYANNYTVGAKLTWSFGASTPAKIALATTQKRELESMHDQTQKKVQTDHQELIADLNKIEMSINRAENKHKLYQENKEILTFQYKRGSIDLYNLLENFAMYIDNFSKLQKIKTDYQSKLIQLANDYTY